MINERKVMGENHAKECKVSEKKDKKKKKKLKKKDSEPELGKDDGTGKIRMKQSKEGKNAEKDITRKKKKVKIRADDAHDGDNSAQEVILKQKKRKKKKRQESDEVNEEKVLKKRKGEESVFVETVKEDSRCANLLALNDDEKVKFSHTTKIKNEKNSKNKRTKSDNGKIDLPPHRFILAPMVGGSELAFRLLCRRYGTELAYTPMMNSESLQWMLNIETPFFKPMIKIDHLLPILVPIAPRLFWQLQNL